MITIDGSVGGGQILRTALGLSCLYKKPFYLTNIRKSRPNPGLQEQHLQTVLAVKKISDAEVEGAYKNSCELKFVPKDISKTKLEVKISTAGSVGLVLQSLLIVGFKYPLDIKISGGATYGKWAASVDFVNNVFGYWLRKMGMEVNIKVLKHGFYPQGGAEVEVKIKPTDFEGPIVVEKIGEVKKVEVICYVSEGLKKKNVLERIVKEAKEKIANSISNVKITTKAEYVNSLCDGCGLTLVAECEEGVLGSSVVGEIKKSSEQIAVEAVECLLEDLKTDALDRYTSDQIIPYLGILSGKVKVSKVTEHVSSNIEVVERFLPVKFEINKNFISVKKV